MTARQDRFVAEYLIDANATAAAKRAGYSERTAGSIGQENLTKPEISSAIAEARRQRSERTRVSQDRVIEELARIAFSKISDILDWDGESVRVKSIEEMGDAAAAIANIQVTTDRFEKGDGVFLVRTRVLLRLHDKIRPLHLLAQHVGLFEENAAIDPNDVEAQIARTAEGVMKAVRKLGIQTSVSLPEYPLRGDEPERTDPAD